MILLTRLKTMEMKNPESALAVALRTLRRSKAEKKETILFLLWVTKRVVFLRCRELDFGRKQPFFAKKHIETSNPGDLGWAVDFEV